MNLEDDMDKFVSAQNRDYNQALAEIKNGRKQGHWIWYIFPQISGLGMSTTSAFYGIKNIGQASRYLEHPVLGKRLIEISNAILEIKGKTANQILGSPDDLKLRSSMTLFNLVKNTDPVFQAVLDKYFNGIPDQRTIDLVKKS
ncbi:DUF1810 domain-containing protein [Dyadobacter subterraneus]|uniref:DUF1810 domain-containing protein n=1 Tax=Dyadobacter subterraneus TaxID=2773304 RepID=A0ABR9W7V4_9BACT|nr:DUF1810 domain-containing protein [Dyadobacter subterraneus]MBE9461543.1 DUF1810 domain-containing protein [Dyadobacter subterraneus]